MKKLLSAVYILLVMAGYASADTVITGGSNGVKTDTDCNQSQYYPLGTLCQDTDDGKLYKGTGAAVEEITSASAGAGDVTGPAASSDGEMAVFSGVGGKTIKRSNSLTGVAYLTSGVVSAKTIGTASGNVAAGDHTHSGVYLPVGTLDDTKGNGDTSYVWSADKVYDQLALKQGLNAGLTSLAGLSEAAGSVVTTSADNTYGVVTSSSGLKLLQNNAGTMTWETVTGTGSPVLATSPTLVAPTLGAATATSINKTAITAPASGSTLAIADGKTFTASKTITLSSAGDNVTATLPASSGTIAYSGTLTNSKWCTSDGTSIICNTDAPTGAGTITEIGDIASGPAFTAAVPGKSLIFNNATSGTVEVKTVSGALGTRTVSLPAETGTVCTTGSVCTGYAPSATAITTSSTVNALASSTSANLATLLSDEVGTGYAVLNTAPTFVTSIAPTTNDGAALGTSSLMWSDLFLASGGVVNFNNGDVTLTHSSNTITLGGGDLALGANNLTMTGSLGATGAGKLTKVWTADLESTNYPSVNGTSMTSITTVTPGANVATFLATPTSANLASALTNETGSGVAMFGTSPSVTTDIRAASFGGATLGTTSYPFSHLYMGASGGTYYFDITGTPGTSNKTLTIPNETGTFCTTGSVCTGYQGTDTDLTSLAGGITGLVKGAGNGGGYSAATAGSDYPGLASTNAFTGNNTFGDGDTDTLTLRSLLVGGNSRAVWIAGSAPTPTYATGTNELYVAGDIEAGGTVYGAAFVSTGGSDGNYRLESANNTTRTPAASEYSLYFEAGTDLKFAINGSEKTAARLEDAQTFTGAKTFTGGLYSGDASTAASLRLYDGSSNYWTITAPSMSGNYTLTLPADDGDSGQVLSTNGSGTLSWVNTSSSVAGSDTQVQFNDGGSTFGGDAGFTYNKTTQRLTVGKNGTGGGLIIYNELGASDYNAVILPSAGQAAPANYYLPPATAYLTGGNVTLAGPTSTRRTYTGPDADATLVVEGTATGGIILGDSSPDANGEIGYASNAFNWYANSEDMVVTASTNLWTFSSTSSATYAFTPSVALNGGATIPTGNNLSVAGTGYLAFGADPADSGAVRLSNNTAVAWEASTPGTDVFIALDSSDILHVGQNAATISIGTSGTGNTTVVGDLTVTGNDIIVGSVGNGARITGGNGLITFKGEGDGQDEDLTINLNVTNTATVSSSTGVTDISLSALNLATTGSIAGGIPITSDNNGMTSGEMTTAGMYGRMYLATGAGTWNLPGAATGMNFCIYSTTAAAIVINPDNGDTITLNGTALSAGDSITSASGAGDFICLLAVSADSWITLGRSGTWTDTN